MKLEDKIIQKIKEEKIEPKPFWYFLVKDYSLWGLVLLSIILAALSIAPIIFIFQNLELGYAKHITGNIFNFLLFTLPYPWIALCLITTYLASKAWENTKHGYKFDGKKVLVISLITSLILGLSLNIWNVGRKVDDEFRAASFGGYKSFEEKRGALWFNPGAGRLIGEINKVASSSFTLSNEKNNFTKEIFFDETIPGKENISNGNSVRVVGFENKKEENKFIACAVFPDNLPPEDRPPRKILRKDLKELKGKNEIHEECKNIFEKGRANFVK